MTKFEIDETYEMTWITDSELKTKYKVIKRTPKTVTIVHLNDNRQTTHRVKEWQGVEQVSPHGVYSMSPVLRADRKL